MLCVYALSIGVGSDDDNDDFICVDVSRLAFFWPSMVASSRV